MNTFLTLLLIIWGVLLFGGWLFGKYNADQTHKIHTDNRILSSIMLFSAGWSWQSWRGGDLALFIALGMTFGLLGDFLMAQLIVKGEKSVLGGMLAFGIGHVCYIVGILSTNSIHLIMWIVFLIIGAILWYGVVYRTAKTITVLHYAALPYALLLASTAGFASGAALLDSTFILMAIGAVLFLISDLILATQLFNGVHFKGIGDVVWLTYGPAQMLIVYAMPMASTFANF